MTGSTTLTILSCVLVVSTLAVLWFTVTSSEQWSEPKLTQLSTFRLGICLSVGCASGLNLGFSVSRPLPGLSVGLILGFVAALGLLLAAQLVFFTAFWVHIGTTVRTFKQRKSINDKLLAASTIILLGFGSLCLAANLCVGPALLLLFLCFEVKQQLQTKMQLEHQVYMNLSLAGATVCMMAYIRLGHEVQAVKFGTLPDPTSMYKTRYLMLSGRVLFVSAFANRLQTEMFSFTETCEALAEKAVPAARAIVIADIVAMSLGLLLLVAHDVANIFPGRMKHVIAVFHMEDWVFWGSLLLSLFYALATYLHHVWTEMPRSSVMSATGSDGSWFASARKALAGGAPADAFSFSNDTMQLWQNVSLIGALLSFMVLEM